MISYFFIGFHTNIAAVCRISSTKSYLDRFCLRRFVENPKPCSAAPGFAGGLRQGAQRPSRVRGAARAGGCREGDERRALPSNPPVGQEQLGAQSG